MRVLELCAVSGQPARDTDSATSAENVETLRRYHDVLNETGEPPLELFHSDVEIHMFRGYSDRLPATAGTMGCGNGAETPSTLSTTGVSSWTR